MKAYWRREVELQPFLTSGLDESGQIHAKAVLPPSKRNPIPIAKEAGWAPEPV